MHSASLLLNSLGTAFSALVLSSLPVFLGREKVIKERWCVWLVLFSAFGGASALLVFLDFPWFFYAIILFTVAGMANEIWRLKNLSTTLRSLLLLGVLTLPSLWICYPAKFFPLFLLVAAFDIGGWVGGHSPLNRGLLSKKLAPRISPNKTWAGVVGAVALAALTNWSEGDFLGFTFFAACVLALVGDLAASAIKRKAGIKDFGSTLPGFGGVLDRFDSLLFAGLMLVLV